MSAPGFERTEATYVVPEVDLVDHPLTLLLATPEDQWVRCDGFVSVLYLVKDLRAMLAKEYEKAFHAHHNG
jgi:hypothetical protein